jgi:GT2 family glycosyltransferase
MKEEFDTPILYLIFNRPDLVKQTFPQIKAQRPRQLFIGSDGPRVSNENDQVKCAECRDWVMSQIDWDCEVKTLFRGENLGCGLAVSQAITWFFEHVEMGIILEDDIYVEKSFFEYCANLLRAYRNDDTIMHVGGCNFGLNQNTACGYFMSIYNESWGWATWKRA